MSVMLPVIGTTDGLVLISLHLQVLIEQGLNRAMNSSLLPSLSHFTMSGLGRKHRPDLFCCPLQPADTGSKEELGLPALALLCIWNAANAFPNGRRHDLLHKCQGNLGREKKSESDCIVNAGNRRVVSMGKKRHFSLCQWQVTYL